MIRSPAVAGMFYPDDAAKLKQEVASFLRDNACAIPAPKALIVPHAGYIYSGPVAGSAFSTLKPVADKIKRVVLLGPSHRVPFRGVAASSAEAFTTPLGLIKLDTDALEKLIHGGQVIRLDQAHQMEHSLEVQLPFLQSVLPTFLLVPLVVGDASAEDIATLLEPYYKDTETLIIISSDLSHYLDYASAKTLDEETAGVIENLQVDELAYEQACGRTPVNGLLRLAQKHQLHVKRLDLRNSGDTAGSKEQVVGYGAWAFFMNKNVINNNAIDDKGVMDDDIADDKYAG